MGKRSVRALFWGFVLLASLSCNTLTGAFEDVGVSGCEVPDVVGLEQGNAERSLRDLGLMPVVETGYDADVTAGQVVSQDPGPGVQLESCEGEIVLVVSIGPEEQSEPPEISSEVAPGSSDGSFEDSPMFHLFYQVPFETGIGGFRPEWSVDANPEASYLTDIGELVTDGYVAAYVGDSSWFDYRITFGNADYSQVKDFHLLARTQDNLNYIGMQCFVTDGWLVCEGRKVIDGQEGPVAGFQSTTKICAIGQIECRVGFEAIGNQYRVLSNDEERVRFVDDTFTQGGIGVVVDGRWVVDSVEVYEPDKPASAGYVLFRDDFATDAWSTGAIDDDYVESSQVIENGIYRWELHAKRGVVLKELQDLYVPFDSESFPYHFSLEVNAQRVSGPENVTYGLLFRAKDHNNLYYFSVRDKGIAAFYTLEDGSWVELVPPTQTDAIRSGEENRLRVVVRGTNFGFFVNDQYLFQAMDDSFTMDVGIGLAVELFDAGDNATIEFDDVSIWVP